MEIFGESWEEMEFKIFEGGFLPVNLVNRYFQRAWEKLEISKGVW